MVLRAKLHEQVKDLFENLVWANIVAVHLVDDHQRRQPGQKSLGQDVAGLGHDAFEGVHQEEHAVGHPQHPLDLSGEVRVPGGIDDIDVVAHAVSVRVVDGAVLREDRNSAFTLDRIGIEDALAGQLAMAELAALAKQLVDQRGLAVIHVGDDGYVADVLSVHRILWVSRQRMISWGD